MLKTKKHCSQILDPISMVRNVRIGCLGNTYFIFNTSQQATPAQFIFGRGMIFNLKSLIHWKTMALKHQ